MNRISTKIKKFFMPTKKVVILGNCQAPVLRLILNKYPAFQERCEIIELPPIHLLNSTHENMVFDAILQADVFIHQPISEVFGIYATDNLKKMLKKNALTICFPVIYFSAYNPETIYLKDKSNKKTTLAFDYHDLNLLKAFDMGLSVDETISKISAPDFYSRSLIEQNIQNSFESLQIREKTVDIRVSDFITKHMHGNSLFFSMNHPINSILFFVADHILATLNLPLLDDTTKKLIPPQLLGRSILYKYDAIKQYFEIPQEDLIIDLKPYTLKEYVDICFQQYTQNSDLVKYNLSLHLNGNDEIKAILAKGLF